MQAINVEVIGFNTVCVFDVSAQMDPVMGSNLHLDWDHTY